MSGKFWRGMAFVMVTLLCVAGLGGCGGGDEEAAEPAGTGLGDLSPDTETTADETADEAADETADEAADEAADTNNE